MFQCLVASALVVLGCSLTMWKKSICKYCPYRDVGVVHRSLGLKIASFGADIAFGWYWCKRDVN